MPRKKIITRLKASNWQTTAAGILALAGTAASIYGTATGNPAIATIGNQAAAVFGGGGLILAKDSGQ